MDIRQVSNFYFVHAKKVSFFLIVSISFIFFGNSVKAQVVATSSSEVIAPISEPEIYSLSIDQDTILKGYTVTFSNGDFNIGLLDKAVTEAVDVTIKKIPDSYMLGPLASSTTSNIKASPIWEFDIKTKAGKLGVLKKPIYLSIKTDNKSMIRKVAFFWDKAGQKWVALPSVIDLKNNLVKTIIHLPYARVALFEEDHVYEAYASWYPTELTKRDTMGCASNVYPMNTKLKVCRLDNLQKCVLTTVISVGPYVDNRIIDLTRKAFDKIGNSRGGVLGVRVEPINKSLLVQTEAERRDMKRINDILQIQTALAEYFKEKKVFPEAAMPIILGRGQANFLCESGFQASQTDCQKVYLANLASEGSNLVTPYLYFREKEDHYHIYFSLEQGAYKYKKGKMLAYEKGMVNSSFPDQDQDRDHLSDERENELGSDPQNPDTNSDGYSDGFEIINAFNET